MCKIDSPLFISILNANSSLNIIHLVPFKQKAHKWPKDEPP